MHPPILLTRVRPKVQRLDAGHAWPAGVGGGAGTASDAAHAVKANPPLTLLAVPPLWREFFSSLSATAEGTAVPVTAVQSTVAQCTAVETTAVHSTAVHFEEDVADCCRRIEALLHLG